ncbi:MAG TPA: acyl-protein synthetase, partial [Polyangiaceae bacterium]
MTPHAESDALHARARARIEAFRRGREPPEPFDVLAVDLARHQARHVGGYARLCAARGVEPSRFRSASDAPAVPTDAFKLAHVFAFPPEDARVSFRTSGTTVGARGTHRMRDAGTYDAAALAFGRAMLFAGTSSPDVIVLGPSPSEAPDSSLAHMCGLFARSVGRDASGDETWFVREGTLDVAGLRGRLAALPAGHGIVLLATSFALVHLLDALG